MENFMHNIFFMTLVSLTLGASLAAEINNTSLIQYSLKEDGRKWKVAFETKPDQPQSVKQLILDNESPDTANELVTIQSIPGIQITPEEFFKLLIKQIEQSVPGGNLESKIISTTPESLFGEWWIKDKTENSQHEWIRIFKKGDVLSIIRYTTKNVNDLEKSRQVWEKILSESHL